MNIMQKVLNTMERDKGYFTKELINDIQKEVNRDLTRSEMSSIRTSLSKLSELGVMKKEKVKFHYCYTLLKSKDEYKRILESSRKRKEKVYKDSPVEWYSLKTLGHVEQMCKTLNTPIPRTRNEIESFYHTVKSQTI